MVGGTRPTAPTVTLDRRVRIREFTDPGGLATAVAGRPGGPQTRQRTHRGSVPPPSTGDPGARVEDRTNQVLHLELPAEARSVSLARRQVSEYVEGDHCAHVRAAPGAGLDLLQVVALLTTELVANAVLHGGGPVVEVTVDCSVGGVRVTCADDDPTAPVVHHVDVEATSGRGMALVDVLADDWGSLRSVDGRGKQVWFQIGSGGPAPG